MNWDRMLEQRLRATYAPPRRARSRESSREARPPLSVVPDVKATALSTGVLLEAAGRAVLVAPAGGPIPDSLQGEWAARASANPHVLTLIGRYVQAEAANSNGALWTTGDLEFGEPGVRGGPLNWLHAEHKVVGAITEAALVRNRPEVAGSIVVGDAPCHPYIATAAGLWTWLYPREARMAAEQAAAGGLWQSMECVADSVECGACHGRYSYAKVAAADPAVCSHVRERSATRRFVDPVFLGSGLILPPVRPGWADAHVHLMPVATRLAEAASAGAPPDMSASDFEGVIATALAS